MVRIVNFEERLSEEGKSFFVLIIQSGIELVESKKTGGFYATARKASITSTFDEMTCKSIVGTEIPGSIIKLECEPYDYTIKETGEVIQLTHKYHYTSEESSTKKEMSSTQIEDFVKLENKQEAFSLNGVD